MPWSADGGVRLCGTPGCELRDFHDGPCSCDAPADGSRQRQAAKRTEPAAPHAAQPQQKKPRRTRAAAAPASPECDPRPAQQFQLPSGLSRFYHVHSWGVPLPDGRMLVAGDRRISVLEGLVAAMGSKPAAKPFKKTAKRALAGDAI